MNPDELKAVWQSQPSLRRLTIDAEVLLQQLQRNKKSFETMIIWRDFREVGVALVMVPLWIWIGRLVTDTPWTWYLCVPAYLWIAGFMIVDRVRQRRSRPERGEPLRECAEHSLAQVEHQIWLLRNVFWWYLLPPVAGLAAFFGSLAWRGELLVAGGMILAVGLVFGGVYWANQVVVRDELEPRRRELEAVLASLKSADNNIGPAAPPSPGTPS